MSSTVLKFIATRPDFVPKESVLKQVETLLADIFKHEEKTYDVTDQIEFIDSGSNFEKITCNLCGSNIELDDWQYDMSTAYEVSFSDLNFITSCCKRANNLNELEYFWPSGFAKFVICILEAHRDINKLELGSLEIMLGQKVRKIWTHY